LRVRSEVIVRTKKTFNENGITSPFRIRTLNFVIKGGQSISEMPLTIAGQNGRENGKPDQQTESRSGKE
jgi:small conductance mechanosensitive channel